MNVQSLHYSGGPLKSAVFGLSSSLPPFTDGGDGLVCESIGKVDLLSDYFDSKQSRVDLTITCNLSFYSLTTFAIRSYSRTSRNKRVKSTGPGSVVKCNWDEHCQKYTEVRTKGRQSWFVCVWWLCVFDDCVCLMIVCVIWLDVTILVEGESLGILLLLSVTIHFVSLIICNKTFCFVYYL